MNKKILYLYLQAFGKPTYPLSISIFPLLPFSQVRITWL